MSISKTLREDRFKLVTDANVILQNAKATAEDIEKAKSMLDASDALMTRIELTESAERKATAMNDIVTTAAYSRSVSGDSIRNELQLAQDGATAQLRMRLGVPLNARDKRGLEYVTNLNQQTEGTGAQGGFTVASVLQNQIILAMTKITGIRDVNYGAYVFATDQGNSLLLPQINDTTNTGSSVTEIGSIGSAANVVVSQATISAYTFTSGEFLVSKDLIQDSAFDFNSLIQNLAALRLARTTNTAYTTGSGSSAPQGIVTAATLGWTSASNSAIAVTDVINMEFAIDPIYRPGAAYMCSDSALRSLRLQVDTLGRPLWQPSLQVGSPDLLNGYPVLLNTAMDSVAASNKPLLFGNFKNFWIRDVNDIQFQTLVELHAQNRQIGIIATMRTDSRAASTGNWATYLQMHS